MRSKSSTPQGLSTSKACTLQVALSFRCTGMQLRTTSSPAPRGERFTSCAATHLLSEEGSSDHCCSHRQKGDGGIHTIPGLQLQPLSTEASPVTLVLLLPSVLVRFAGTVCSCPLPERLLRCGPHGASTHQEDAAVRPPLPLPSLALLTLRFLNREEREEAMPGSTR